MQEDIGCKTSVGNSCQITDQAEVVIKNVPVVEKRSVEVQTETTDIGIQTDKPNQTNQTDLMLKYVSSSLHWLIKSSSKPSKELENILSSLASVVATLEKAQKRNDAGSNHTQDGETSKSADSTESRS